MGLNSYDKTDITDMPESMTTDWQIFIINLGLVLFVAVVYARNYIVMHGIDTRNYRGSKELRFINLNTGWFDFFERLIRFLIVFIVIVSAKKLFSSLTDIFIWMRNCIVFIPERNKHANDFSYYAVVLIVLFALFILYDLVNVISCKRRVGDQWADHLKQVGNDLEKLINSDEITSSFFSYLNYCEKLDNGRLHIEKLLFQYFSDLIGNKKWVNLYLKSPKFYERLTGIGCSFLLIISAARNFEPFFVVVAAISLVLYLYHLTKNTNVWETIFWALCLGYLLDYLLQIRVAHSPYVLCEKLDYSIYDYFNETKIKVNKMRKSKKISIGVGSVIVISVIAFFIKINMLSYVTWTNLFKNTESKQSLVVWQTEVDKEAIAVLAKVEAEFERRNPKVDLKIESVSWGGLSEKLNTAIRTNTLPDVSHIQPFMAYSLISKGLLSPITEFVKELDQQEGGILPG